LIPALFRLVWRAVMWPLFGFAALWASFELHVEMPLTQRAIKDTVQVFISSKIRGQLQVGSFDNLGERVLHIRNIQLWDPRGKRVVHIDRLELELNLDAAKNLRLHVAGARVHGGTVHLRTSPFGQPTLLWALESVREGDTEDVNPYVRRAIDAVKSDAPVRVDGIELHDVQVDGDLLGLEGIRARDVTASGHVIAGDEVVVKVSDAQLQLERPFGFPARIDGIHGTFSSDARRSVLLHATGYRDDERVHARVVYGRPQGSAADVLDLSVDASPVSADTLQKLGYDWAGPLDTSLVGSLRLRGPLDHLTLNANLMADGGPATVAGTITKRDGADVVIESEGLALDAVVGEGPEMSVKGKLRIVATGRADPLLHATIEPTLFGEIAVPSFDVEGVMGDDGFHVTTMRARQRGATMSGHGTIGLDGATNLQIKARIPDIARDPNLRRMVPNARGSVDANLRIITPPAGGKRLDFRGRITLRNLRYGMMQADVVTLDGSARGDPKLPALNLAMTGTNMRADDYRLGDAKLTVKGGPRKYTASGTFVDRGNRSLRVETVIDATRRQMVINAPKVQLEVGERSWRGTINDLTIVHDRSVEVRRLVLASRGQRLEAAGKITLDGEDFVTATLNNFDLSVVRALLGESFPFARGRATANLELTGDVERPRLSATGLLTDGELLGAKGVGANYFIAYESGRLDLDGQLDFGERGLVLLRGTGRLDADEPDALAALRKADYDVEIVTEKVAFSLVPQLRAQDITGVASATVRGRGHLDEPSLGGQVLLEQVLVPGSAPLRIEGQLEYNHSQIHTEVDIADARGPLGRLTAGAILPWSMVMGQEDSSVDPLAGPWSLQGHTVERRADELPPPLHDLSPIPVTVSTRFQLERTGGPTTGWAAFEVKALEATDASLCHSEVRPRIAGMANLKGAQTEFTMHVTAANMRLGSARGSVYLPMDEWLDERTMSPPSQLSLRGDLQIESFEQLPYLCEQGKGSLAAEWRVDDALTPAPSVEVSVESTFFPRTEAPVATGRTVIRSCEGDPVKISLSVEGDEREAKVAGRMFGCGGGATTAVGTLPVHWAADQAMLSPARDRDMSLKLIFNHAQLRPLIDRIPGVLSGEGYADGELLVHGRIDELQYDGAVGLSEGKMHVVATGQRVTGVAADVRFTRDQAQLVSLHAGVDQGTLDMSGYWNFEHNLPRRAKMVIRLEEFPLRSEGVTLAWMTGAAALETDFEEDRSRTAVKIHALDMRLPDDAGTGIQPLRAHPDIEIVTEGGIDLKPRPFVMEFQIDGLNGMRVHRSDVDMQLVTEIGVHYVEPDLRVGGYTEIRGGTFVALGKPFKVTQGSMRFDGSARVDPEIHLAAVQETAGTSVEAVSVTVDGRLSAPVIRFSASGCPGEAGAIAVLLSGSCPEDLESGGGQGSDAADFGGGLLGGIVSAGTHGQFGGVAPRFAVESRDGSSTVLRAGVETEAPEFIRALVRKIYVEGGKSIRSQSGGEANESTAETSADGLDILLQLYFPHNIVGAGKLGSGMWGLDVTWEP